VLAVGRIDRGIAVQDLLGRTELDAMPIDFSKLLTTQTNLLWAAAVSAIVSAVTSYLLRLREERHKLEAEYEYEQRKRLRNLIGSYHGRLLNAANSLNYRLWNLYKHHDRGWLRVGGTYPPENYYFHSFIHRFLNVFFHIRQFEREAVVVDARIAEPRDFLFLKYLAALRWCMTDVALFHNVPYDHYDQTDHFFSDAFRQYCDDCAAQGGEFIALHDLTTRVQTDRTLDSVLHFFDSLSPDEDRLRWDRLVALHLLLVAFVNNFGYEEQRTSPEQFNEIAAQFRHPQILSNLAAWLPRHGLGSDVEAARIQLVRARYGAA
jgi:hypothetical protein